MPLILIAQLLFAEKNLIVDNKYHWLYKCELKKGNVNYGFNDHFDQLIICNSSVRHFHIINPTNHLLYLFPSSAAIQMRKYTNLLFYVAAVADYSLMGTIITMSVGGKRGEPVNCADDLNAGTCIPNYVNILQWHCG